MSREFKSHPLRHFSRYERTIMRKQDEPIFYVYVLLDPRKPGIFQYGGYNFEHEPFYVGKGKGNRCLDHLVHIRSNKSSTYTARKIRKIFQECQLEPIIRKMYINLFECVALETEIFLISQIGRMDLKNGPLTNLTNGGEPPTGYVFTREVRDKMSLKQKGRKHSDETKKKISKAHKGENSYMFGRTMSIDQREKIRKTLIGKMAKEKNPMWGKTRSPESIQKQKDWIQKNIEYVKKTHTGHWVGDKNPNFGNHDKLSEDHRRKISESQKGRISPMKGKKHSDETKKKISNAQKGIPLTDEHKRKISESHKGKIVNPDTILRGWETRRRKAELKLQQQRYTQTP